MYMILIAKNISSFIFGCKSSKERNEATLSLSLIGFDSILVGIN